MQLNRSLVSAVLSALAQSSFAQDAFQASCEAIAPALNIPNATVYSSQFVSAGTNLSLADNNVTCTQPSQLVEADLCRITLYVSTSNRSGINMEAWLPSNWTGRFMSAGNGGVGGCIGYSEMAYASGYGFASVGANNGHNGTGGGAFLNNEDVVVDFAWRSIHTGVVVGKEITKQFYGKAHTKSYYLGCSTGGRQGFKSAQDFPDDFDGIVAGAPAVAFNNLTSWSGHFLPITGPQNSSTFVPTAYWPAIHQDILNQCDALDGYVDGIIEDPLLCNYTAEHLLCNSTSNTTCLTAQQVNTVNEIFSPMYGLNDTFIYPRMQPGSEILASYILYNGEAFPYTTDWFRYAVYNDPTWDPTKISDVDYDNAIRANPGNIDSFKGNLSAVQDRGAKILHYHGQMDGIISSEISPLYREHVSDTMGLSSDELDDFYRFFRISGTGHCTGGDGASVIGQTYGSVQSDEPSENVLMAIVDWVENGSAPDTITGTHWVNGTESLGIDYKRAHCRWPKRNMYKGEGDAKDPASWECVE